MRPLAANLKHLYQFRFMLITNIVLVVGILALFLEIISADTSGNLSEVSWMMFLIFGEMVGLTITGTSAKPFSFCLPNHARAVKKMVLMVWLLTALLCLLILFILYLFNIHTDPSRFIVSMSLMSLCYWSGISVFVRKLSFVPLFIGFTAFSLITITDMGTVILSAVANHPWMLALSSGILCSLIYFAVDSRDNHRKLCTSPWIGGVGASSKSRQRYMKQKWMQANNHYSAAKPVEMFAAYFTERIRSKRLSGFIPHLWGQAYLIIAPIFGRWKLLWAPFLIAFISLILFPCFIVQMQEPASYGFDAIMFTFFSLAFSTFCANRRFKHFLMAGRKIHFFQGIVILLITTLLSLGFFGVSILSFNLLSALFPEIVLMGKSFTIVSIPSILLIIPFIQVPLFGGLVVLFKGLELKIVLSVTAVIALIVTLFGMPAMETAPFFVNLAVVISIAAVTWGFHLAVLYHNSMKRSLC